MASGCCHGGGGGILGWEIWGTLVTKGFEVGSGCSKAPP